MSDDFLARPKRVFQTLVEVTEQPAMEQHLPIWMVVHWCVNALAQPTDEHVQIATQLVNVLQGGIGIQERQARACQIVTLLAKDYQDTREHTDAGANYRLQRIAQFARDQLAVLDKKFLKLDPDTIAKALAKVALDEPGRKGQPKAPGVVAGLMLTCEALLDKTEIAAPDKKRVAARVRTAVRKYRGVAAPHPLMLTDEATLSLIKQL
jgi:hypothetical protein